MPFFCFPSNFVYWEKVDRHEELKSRILPKILAEKDANEGNPWRASIVNSGFDYDLGEHDRKNSMLNDLFIMENVVKQPINNVFSQLSKLYPYKIEDLFVKNWWWNVYERGNFQEQHHHNGEPLEKNGSRFHPLLSVIYILHDENPSSSVLFTHTAPVPLHGTSRDLTFDTGDLTQVEEGCSLVFPSGLRHCVRPCSVPGRVTLSFNVYAKLGDQAEWPIRQHL